METDKQAQEHGKQAYCDGAAVQCSRPIHYSAGRAAAAI